MGRIAKAEFIEAMSVRRAQFRLRLAMGASVGAIFVPIFGWGVVLTWLTVWAGLQLLETSWTRRAERLRDPTEVNLAPVLAVVFVANLVFIGIGLAAAVRGEMLMVVCGVLLMAGALLNAGASSAASNAMFIVSAAPGTLASLVLFLLAVRIGGPPEMIFALAGALGLLLFAVYAMRDVGVKALKAAKAASASKGEFLANLSHEIRTPLNGVLGMAQAMSADELPPAQRERLEVINRSGHALLGLLNDVLDLSKVEAGKLEIELREMDIAEIARDLAGTFGASARSKNVVVEVAVHPDLEGLWLGDPTRLRQILSNLLSNAVKFTSEGKVCLSLAPCGDGVSFEVKDSGAGISADRIEAVFDKYAQASASTSRMFGGTGLGLAICRDLATLMYGTIDVESEVGVGSTFRLWLPLQPCAEAAESEGEGDDGLAELGGLRVLAAEDHETNQMVLRLLLAQVGIDEQIVPDGRAAVEAWKSQAWDLILMDVQMPVLDGPGAVREIRQEELRTGQAPTPILALTANAMRHQIEEYLECGMNGHVSKPLEFEVLLRAIVQALSSAPTGAKSEGRQIA